MGQELVLIGPLCMVLSSMDNGQDDRTQLGASDSNSRHTAPPINVFDIDIDIVSRLVCEILDFENFSVMTSLLTSRGPDQKSVWIVWAH